MKRPTRPTQVAAAARTTSDGALVCSIGELAELLEVTPRTIRFYETKGLIRPARRGTQRVYSLADQTRMRLILRTKNLGYSLEDIAEHLKLYDTSPDQPAELKLLLNKVDAAIAQLGTMAVDLEATLRDLKGIRSKCVASLRRAR